MLRTSLFLAAALCGAAASAQITGTPAADRISRLTAPRDASIIANSVDTGTGAFSLSASVLSINGGRPLELPLLYDSIGPPPSIVARARNFGPGWTHPYAARIEGNPAVAMTVVWDDNRRNTYDFDGSEYVPREESAQYDELTQESSGEWRIVRSDGTTYRFEDDGPLRSIANKIRQRIDVEYDGSGRLRKIVEPISDKEIVFHYPSPTSRRVAWVSDPAGRETHFTYDRQGRLAVIHNPADFGDVLGEAFVPKPIPDNDPNGLVHPFTADRSGPIGLLRLDIFSVGHQRAADLKIEIVSPAGTRVDITDRLDRPSANAFSGDGLVIPDFEGEEAGGTWNVVLTDDRSGSVGELNGIWVQFSDRTYPTYFAYDEVRIVEALDTTGARLFANDYDLRGRVVTQDDGRDDTPPSTFSYAGTPGGGVLTTYVDRSGAVRVFEHDEDYRLLRYVDPLGGETLYGYNSKGERTSVEDPLGRTTTFEYDEDGNVVRVVDPAGNVSTMQYDSRRNMTRFTDAAGESTQFTYNNGNVTQVRDALGHRTRKTYGGNGQLLQNMLHDDAGVQYTYQGGMVVGARRMDARGDKVEQTDYDEIGYPASTTDAEGRETKYEYDARLNVTAVVNPLGDRRESEYDHRNRLVRTVDFNGNETLLQYDGNNNLVARTNALGETTTFLFDVEDRQIEVIDPLGRSSKTEYDIAGRAVRTVDGAGNSFRREYDAVGNLIAIYDGDDRKVRTTRYDERDLPVEIVDANGSKLVNEFDALGNLVRITDGSGASTELRYDELGRLIEVEDPLGRVVKKQYFSDDVVEWIEDATGARTSFSYDNANRVTRIEPFTGRVAAVEFDYDEAYQLTADELPGGASREYEYDDGGRLTRIVYSGDGAPGNRRLSYDANGNLLNVRVESGGLDPAGTQLQRQYDALDRVTSFTDANGDRIGYEYDESGNLVSMTYPDGKVVNYVYDEGNQLAELIDWADRSTFFEYDSNSRLTRIEFPNGVVRSMVYDAAGRLLKRSDVRPSGSMIVEYEYEYDAQGRISVETGGPPAPPYMPDALQMTYRNDGRLATVNGQTVEYDAQHNITAAPLDGRPYDFEYNLNSRLIAVNGMARRYDAADNLIAWRTSAGLTRFTVNPESSLTQVIVQREPTGRTHRYVYAGGLLYEEVDGDIQVYHYDHRGNTVAFTDGSGGLTGTVSYGPYGEISSRTGSADSIFLHGGLWGILTDPETELQYMRYRWYSPQLKRFLSKDAHVGDISYPASLNRYVYAGANPVSFNDPTGEIFNLIAGAVGAVVGGVVGVVVNVTVKAVTGQKITAGDIIGGFVGGAITGGLTGLCVGVCGPAALIAGGAVAGALGSAAGNATTQGVDIATGDRDSFDTSQLLAETAAGAVFGAIPFGGKGGKALTKGLARGSAAGAARGSARAAVTKSVRTIATPAGPIPAALLKPVLGGKTVIPAIARSSAVREAAEAAGRRASIAGALGDFFTDMSVGLAQATLVEFASTRPAPSPQDPPDSARVQSIARQEVNAGNRGVYGEFVHWNLYKAFHSITGTPLPNNPNSPLAEF